VSTDNEKPANKSSAAAMPAKPGPTSDTSNNPWNSIEVGGTVLAQVDKEEGYFPAIVEKISDDGKTLTLRWKAYRLPSFTMRRLAVGLIAVVK
jgi:hypothetical protein